MEQLYKYLIYYYPNKSEEILSMLNMLDEDTIIFLTSIEEQIPYVNYERFKQIVYAIYHNYSTEEFVRQEYDEIMSRWHKDYPMFDIPNGVLSISVDRNTTHIPVGPNPKDDGIYDIASMTKLYTEVLFFRIVKEGKYNISFDTKIRDITDNYPNLDKDLSLDDLLTFGNTFRTYGMINQKKNKEEGLKVLKTSRVLPHLKGQYLYTDIPIMILTDILETVTHKDYKELINEYIINPLQLRNTYLGNLGDDRYRYTGLNTNGVNNPKANVMGGYYGHAGIKTTCDDFILFLNSIFKDGFIANNRFDPIWFKMMSLSKAKTPNYDDIGRRISKLRPNIDYIDYTDLEKKIKECGLTDEIKKELDGIKKVIHDDVLIQLFNDYIDYISSPEDHIRISGPATIGNLNIASENIRMNDYNFDSLASDTLPYTGFEVQGSTRVHGGCSMFALNNQFHSVSISFLNDISNQFDNAKIYINITGKSGVLLTYSTDIGDCVTFDPRSIIPYSTYYGELKDMFGVARIVDLYNKTQLKKKKIIR